MSGSVCNKRTVFRAIKYFGEQNIGHYLRGIASKNTLEQLSHCKCIESVVGFERGIEKYDRFKNKYLSADTKETRNTRETPILFYMTIAIPVLTYANETWLISKRTQSKLQSAEIKMLRNAL